MGVNWSQFFPPAASLTEANLPNQAGKVFLITGGYSGIGLALAKLLYNAGAKVYIAGRSKEKYNAAADIIKCADGAATTQAGQLEFLFLELDDLPSIKASAEEFKSKEPKLDVLFNNAAVSLPPKGSLGKSGKELMLATNVLGPFLLTQHLLPCLEAAAETAAPASVRVVFTTSIVVDMQVPKGGYPLSDLRAPPTDQQARYAHTKLGNWYMAQRFGSQLRDKGVLCIAHNPGNLSTNLTRHMPVWVPYLVKPLLYQPKFGAYTALYAGLSTELGLEDEGGYIIPWGRRHPAPRVELLQGTKAGSESVAGAAEEFWEFCVEQTTE